MGGFRAWEHENNMAEYEIVWGGGWSVQTHSPRGTTEEPHERTQGVGRVGFQCGPRPKSPILFII